MKHTLEEKAQVTVSSRTLQPLPPCSRHWAALGACAQRAVCPLSQWRYWRYSGDTGDTGDTVAVRPLVAAAGVTWAVTQGSLQGSGLALSLSLTAWPCVFGWLCLGPCRAPARSPGCRFVESHHCGGPVSSRWASASVLGHTSGAATQTPFQGGCRAHPRAEDMEPGSGTVGGNPWACSGTWRHRVGCRPGYPLEISVAGRVVIIPMQGRQPQHLLPRTLCTCSLGAFTGPSWAHQA